MYELGGLLEKLKKEKWQKGKFGLGCLQWRGDRTYKLFQIYKKESGGGNKIIFSEAIISEGKMILSELTDKGKYVKVYNEWKEQNPQVKTSKAAYNAGYILTWNYVIPRDKDEQAKIIGNTAKNMYIIMTS